MPTTPVTVADVLEQESLYLMPIPFDGYIEILAWVSSTCLVTMQRNRYSVPYHLANCKVALHLYPGRIEIISDHAIVTRHRFIIDADQVSYDWKHYIPLGSAPYGSLSHFLRYCAASSSAA